MGCIKVTKLKEREREKKKMHQQQLFYLKFLSENIKINMVLRITNLSLFFY